MKRKATTTMMMMMSRLLEYGKGNRCTMITCRTTDIVAMMSRVSLPRRCQILSRISLAMLILVDANTTREDLCLDPC